MSQSRSLEPPLLHPPKFARAQKVSSPARDLTFLSPQWKTIALPSASLYRRNFHLPPFPRTKSLRPHGCCLHYWNWSNYLHVYCWCALVVVDPFRRYVGLLRNRLFSSGRTGDLRALSSVLTRLLCCQVRCILDLYVHVSILTWINVCEVYIYICIYVEICRDEYTHIWKLTRIDTYVNM